MTDVPGGLITLEYAAEGLNFTGVGSQANTARDADITAYIQAATPIIENIVGPVLPTSKTVSFDGGTEAIVLPDVATSVTTVIENGVTLTTTDWMFDPVGSVLWRGTSTHPKCFGTGRLGIQVTYATGYTTIPLALQLAARELVRFWWQQGKAAVRPAYSDALEATPPQGFAVPKRVIELCAPFQGAGFA